MLLVACICTEKLTSWCSHFLNLHTCSYFGKYLIYQCIKLQLSGARRLRDAIVLGYHLQRVPGSEVGVPDWYSLSEKEISLHAKNPTSDNSETMFHAES